MQMAPGRQAQITPIGREMLFVSVVAERWLQAAPGGPIPFESDQGEEAVGALIDGWSSALVHALAERPLGESWSAP